MESDTSKNFIFHQNGGVFAVVIFFVLLFVFAKWGPAINFATTTQTKGQPMVVSGQGKAVEIPDIAKVSAGIQVSGPSLSQTQNDANKKSQTLVEALKKMGIEDKDIKTVSYYIYPQQDYQANPPKITGYQVSTSYEITIRNIDKVNTAITTVTNAGANLVGSVTFDLSDDAKAKALDVARLDAVAKAKKNAESLAKAAGVTLGPVINISENQSGGNPILFAAPAASGGLLQKTDTQPNVQPGSTEVDVTVSLSYDLR